MKTRPGRFELIEELGAGGMGIVYRAYDKKVGEEIALKVLHPEIALDERTVDRFRNEIKLARKISHRNVCRMHELHEDDKTLFLTMEYVSGQDLKSFIGKSGALGTGQALSIAKQVAEGLAEAHNLGVIHRNLKPQNIMVDKEGNAKIMDFGIARSLRTAGMTAEGMIIGTPEYMAPEQVEGLEADQRTDIYAFGAILFEMVTGRVPFEGDSPLSVAYKHKNEIPIPPRKLNTETPEPFNKMILRCLEKQKENRYQTAEEVLGDLIRIEEGLPISERVVLKARPTIRIAREKPTGVKRLLVPALGVLVLALAAFIALRILPKKPVSTAPSKPTLAILYFENISGDPDLDPWKTGLITKLGQSKYLNVLPPDRIFSLLKKLNLEEAKKYSTEDLVKVAKEGEATYTLSGSLMKAGKSIMVALTLQKPQTGEVISPLNIQCDGEEAIFARVDDLGNQIKTDLKLTSDQIAGDVNDNVGQVLTSSPEALKYYQEASRPSDYSTTVKLLEKAIAIDPEFAMAYRELGETYFNNYEAGKSVEYLQKAFDYRGRLALRERCRIEESYYEKSSKTVGQAVEALNKLIETYPDDIEGRRRLASLYINGGEPDLAITTLLEAASLAKPEEAGGSRTCLS